MDENKNPQGVPEDAYIVGYNRDKSIYVYSSGDVYFTNKTDRRFWNPNGINNRELVRTEVVKALRKVEINHSYSITWKHDLKQILLNPEPFHFGGIFFIGFKNQILSAFGTKSDEKCDACNCNLRWIHLQLRCPQCYKVYAG